MNTHATYDPETHRVSLDISPWGLQPSSIRALYSAIVQLSDNAPDLLASITFDGARLELAGTAEDAQKALAVLASYVDDAALLPVLRGPLPPPVCPEPERAIV